MSDKPQEWTIGLSILGYEILREERHIDTDLSEYPIKVVRKSTYNKLARDGKELLAAYLAASSERDRLKTALEIIRETYPPETNCAKIASEALK